MSASPGPRSRREPWPWLPRWASETLPRYTSYPPANRFGEMTAEDAQAAITGLPAGARLSLYLHIPFCRTLCWYCGCHTSTPTAANPLDTYLDALIAEVDLVAALVPAGARVTQIHFGGGSPDSLGPEGFDRLLARLRRAFRIDAGAEIAVELDPRGATADFISSLGANGVNRASVGVQVLDPGVQRAINRVQPAGLVAHAIDRLLGAGVSRINIDMMYGLPHQTVEHVVETATFASQHEVARVAVFGYAHAPWFKKHQGAIRPADLPGPEARFRQAEAAAETLEAARFAPIGFDHYAAPDDEMAIADRAGALRRNFQGYTVDPADALIGLGASAISTLSESYIQTTTDTATYRTEIFAGRLAARRGIRTTERHRAIAAAIGDVLCTLETTRPPDLSAAALERLEDLKSDGLIERAGDRILVTDSGRPYLRNIAATFDPEMFSAPARHSLAI